MKVLVTGGAGYLGIHIIIKLLKKKNINVFILDDFSNSNIQILKYIKKSFKNKLTIKKINLKFKKKIENVFIKNDFDHIIHLAAKIDAKESSIKKKMYMINNYEVTKNLLDFANKYNVKKFIFASSAAIYGNVKKEYCFENQRKYPINPYGLSKLKSENYIIRKTKKTKYYIIRIFNLVGFEKLYYKYFKSRNSIYFKLLNISNNYNKTIYVSKLKKNKKSYTTRRDFINVKDVANIFIKTLTLRKKNIIFNCGTGERVSILELVKHIEKKRNINFNIKYKIKSKNDPFSVIASTKIFKGYFNNYKLKKLVNKNMNNSPNTK